ncbi:hypothetical protein [Gordonia sp. (in: high G+C Gram-positive bacteria)]|uniref:hypothetical protein n=1 Tax=Gordonia sp. (in: high G+C Gram-positive bacteria) TaxID=84139 RepID=UPI003C78F9BF
MRSIAEAVEDLRRAGLRETAEMRDAEGSALMTLSAAIGAARDQELRVRPELARELGEMVDIAVSRERWRDELHYELAVLAS